MCATKEEMIEIIEEHGIDELIARYIMNEDAGDLILEYIEKLIINKENV